MAAELIGLSADDYHADNAGDRPTLSASIANVLISDSPAHAYAKHPKLNPDWRRHEEDRFDVGTAAHALILQGVSVADILPFKDWRTKDAQQAKAESRAAGRVPLLEHQWQAVSEMTAAVREQLPHLDAIPPLFTDGDPEQTLIWEDEYGVICRSRIDWLRTDRAAIDDLKTTSRTANPAPWARSTLFSIGADVQAAFYLRGLKALTGEEPSVEQFRFCVVETTPPYAVSLVGLAPDTLALADKKVRWALEKWARCVRDDAWPAYERRVHYAELPAWEEARWLERELSEAAA